MQPIPITQSLPEIDVRVLAFNQGEWEIGALMAMGDGEEPIWIFDCDQSVTPAVTHWMPLPPTP